MKTSGFDIIEVLGQNNKKNFRKLTKTFFPFGLASLAPQMLESIIIIFFFCFIY
jgi:hypothetical protein